MVGANIVKSGRILLQPVEYVKKPVVIEAMKFEYTTESIDSIREWAGSCIGNISKARHPLAKAELEIGTLEDGIYLVVKHIATEGDFIIKGVQGEFYACKPDIFEMTYQKVPV